MNTPIEPPTNEPNLPKLEPIKPIEPKIEQAAAAEAKPDKGQKKQGSVYTKGLQVCGNCGTELLGETCYQCGQPIKGLVRQFSSIVGDFLDTVLNIDARVFRTIGPLIYKPGFLTQEYFSGRRIRYVSPVRLFFFLAVLTFLLAQFSLPESMGSDKDGNDIVQVNAGGKDEISRAKTIEEVEKIRTKALSELNDAKKEAANVPLASIAIRKTKEQVDLKADNKIAELKKTLPSTRTDVAGTKTVDSKVKDNDGDQDSGFSIDGETWDFEKNPIKVEWLPEFVNKWFNSLAQRAENNGKRVSKEPQVIIEALLSALPMTLFLMLPVFALLLKIMFIFKRRLYMEHLIVALHSHAFLMLSILLLILFNDVTTWFAHPAWVTVPFGIFTALLWVWMPIYLFLMQKRVYQQGWTLTFIKYAIIGNLYLILLGMAIVCTLVIKMIWL